MKKEIIVANNIDNIYDEINALIREKKTDVKKVVNDAIISLNWGIGKRLSVELTGNNKPQYGKKVVAEVSKRLEQEYDGSGQVLRDPKNHSLCTFQTGKRYNCDLSASYNIGARYFIRELLKPLPATERSLLEAKVPSVKRRTSCTYADLRELRLQMEVLKAA